MTSLSTALPGFFSPKELRNWSALGATLQNRGTRFVSTGSGFLPSLDVGSISASIGMMILDGVYLSQHNQVSPCQSQS